MAKDIRFNVHILVDGKEQVVTATTSVSGLRAAVDSARGASERLARSMISYNQAVQAVQNVAGAFGQLSGTLASLTQENRAFGAAMREANTMAGKDAAGFSELKGQVSALAENVALSREELARGLYQVISNGVPEDNWISYLEASSRSAVGGIADVGEVVKVTSTIIKNYGLEWDAARDIQDKIQLTAKNGVTSFEQLAAALPSVTGQAAQLGVSLTEMLAVMSTLTGVTGNTSEVSTQLSSVLTALTKESARAQETAAGMGVSFNAASVRAAGGLRNFLAELDRTVTAYAERTGQLKESVYSRLFGRAEALRMVNALTGELAGKFGENIAALEASAGTMDAAYAEMASTGSAKLQVLKNKWGELTDWIAAKAGTVQPFLDFGSQLGMTAVSVVALTKAFKGLAAANLFLSRSFVRSSVALLAFGTNSRRVAAANEVLAQSFRSAATRAVAMKVALRALMSATAVGAALMAVGLIVEKLCGNMEDAKEAADGLSGAEGVLKRVEDAAGSSFAEQEAQIRALTDRIHDNAASVDARREAVQKLKDIVPGYNAEISKEGAIIGENTRAVKEYLVQLEKQVKYKAAEDELVSLYKKQREETNKRKEAQEEYNKALAQTRASVRTVKAGDLGDTGIKAASPGALRNLEAARSKLRGIDAEAEKTAASIKAVRDELDAAGKAGTGSGNPDRGASTSPSTPASTRPSTPSSSKPAAFDADARTLGGIEANIAALRERLKEATADNAAEINRQIRHWEGLASAIRDAGAETRDEAGALDGKADTIERLQKNLDILAERQKTQSGEALSATNREIRATEELIAAMRQQGVESASPADSGPAYDAQADTIEEISGNISYYQDLRDKANRDEIAGINESIRYWEKKKRAMEEAGNVSVGGALRSGWDAVQGISGGIGQMTAALEGNGNAWQKISGTISGVIAVAQGISAVAGLIDMFRGASVGGAAGQAALAASTAAAASAQGSQAGVAAASIAPNVAAAVPVKALASAYRELAASEFFAAHAMIPFAGAGIAAGMVAAMTASVTAAAAPIVALAEGGVAAGPTLALVGEYPGARSNPEVIAPLDRLRSLVEPGLGKGGRVDFRIRGRNLEGVLDRRNRYRART